MIHKIQNHVNSSTCTMIVTFDSAIESKCFFTFYSEHNKLAADAGLVHLDYCSVELKHNDSREDNEVIFSTIAAFYAAQPKLYLVPDCIENVAFVLRFANSTDTTIQNAIDAIEKYNAFIDSNEEMQHEDRSVMTPGLAREIAEYAELTMIFKTAKY